MSITPVKFVLPPLETPLLHGSAQISQGSASASSGGFGNILEKALGSLKDVHGQSGQLIQDYAAGGEVDVSEIMVAMEKTSLSTELAVQIRNKFVESYQEIMRMSM